MKYLIGDIGNTSTKLCILNEKLLVVLAIPGIFGPLVLDVSVMDRDWTATLLLTGTLMGFAWIAYARTLGRAQGSGELGRAAGVVLVGMYTAYIGLLITYPDFTW